MGAERGTPICIGQMNMAPDQIRLRDPMEQKDEELLFYLAFSTFGRSVSQELLACT